MNDTQATVEAIAALRADPTLFVEQVLGATPQAWQAKALDAIASNDRVAIKSGHGVGKTAFLSWTVLWWLCTHYPCKVAVTANTAHQLSDVLWTEIDKWARNLPEGFKSLLEFKSDKISLKVLATVSQWQEPAGRRTQRHFRAFTARICCFW